MKILERSLLLLSLLMIFVAQVRAEKQPEVTYIDCSWDSENNVVKAIGKTITDYVVFQNSSTLALDNNHKYWVAPAGKTTVSDSITIIGDDVHIILSEGDPTHAACMSTMERKWWSNKITELPHLPKKFVLL